MTLARPSVGFLGAGWIGARRLNGLAAAGIAEIVAVADADRDAAAKAAAAVGARALRSMDELLALRPDGIVIATPSAQHAAQAIAALQSGCAVFCQKPLGRTAAEVESVVTAARRAGRLLGVDFSYRHVSGIEKIHALVERGDFGRLYAAELVFHNAYGPDKPWFYDRRLSGGGCVIDLGVHLVDLALWMMGGHVTQVTSRLFGAGAPWSPSSTIVEDFALFRMDFHDGGTAQISCSWRLPAGRDAIIEAAFYGTKGAARWRNVNGSFYDFVAERLDGTRSSTIAEPPDDWGPGAIVRWASELQRGTAFDPGIERVIEVARTIDAVYRLPIDAETSAPVVAAQAEAR